MLRAFLEINWRNNMSWQERIEGRKQEQTQAQNKIERKSQEEQRLRYESLIEMANNLDLKGLLGEIRDQVWNLGEITSLTSMNPSEDEIPFTCSSAEKPFVAFILRAEWPCYSDGYFETYWGEWSEKHEFVPCPHEEIHREELCILCEAVGEKRRVSLVSGGKIQPFASFKFTSTEETRQKIEEALVQYYSRPSWVINEPPYDKKARKDLEELEKWKKRQPPPVQTVQKSSLWERFKKGLL